MVCRPVQYPALHRWRMPSNAVLQGERRPGGRPPFDPFLTASMIWTAHVCPVAALHELLHGRPLRPGGQIWARRQPRGITGTEWHQYISRLRLKVAAERLSIPSDAAHALAVIRHDFENWAHLRQVPDAAREETWQAAVEPYARTRLASGELAEIRGHALLPELTLGSPAVAISLGAGQRSYPIEARVDEVDLTAGVMIERTTLAIEHAAASKPIQLALASAIIRSVPVPGIPTKWAALKQIKRYFVETPNETIAVDPEDMSWLDAIHEAAAIIRDLAGSELSERPIWAMAQCTPVQPHAFCSHPFVECFYKVPVYPQTRAAVKRDVRILCRALLYELLWQRDLAKYRLYNQVASGDAFPGVPIEFLKTGQDARGHYLEVAYASEKVVGLERGTLIVGTAFVGVRRNVGVVEDAATGTARLYCDVEGLPLPGAGMLWPSTDEGLVLEEAPHFLLPNRQSELFALRRIGSSNHLRAEDNATIQILEAVFGGSTQLETS